MKPVQLSFIVNDPREGYVQPERAVCGVSHGDQRCTLLAQHQGRHVSPQGVRW